MNLFLAAVWLVFAVVLLLWPWIGPTGKGVTIGESGFSLGWVALVLCVYNLVRWWSTRATADPASVREALARKHEDEERRDRPEKVPDPNFDFTDKPPT